MKTQSTLNNFFAKATILVIALATSLSVSANTGILTLDELKKEKVFYSLEEALKTPESVVKLSLYDNALLILPSVIKEFSNLQVLDISNNYITKLPAEIGTLNKLQYLNIESNDLQTLPAEIAKLTSLKVLNVSKNQLTEVPAGIANLTNLEVLNLSYNNITEFPAVNGMTELAVLNLQNNNITKVDDAIGNLAELNTLNLKYNDIHSFPAEIANLKNLVSFEFDLHKISIREMRKMGEALITTNTEVGKRALQTASFTENGELADYEIYVEHTNNENNTYTSSFNYNHITQRDMTGTGSVTWTLNGNNVVVVSYTLN